MYDEKSVSQRQGSGVQRKEGENYTMPTDSQSSSFGVGVGKVELSIQENSEKIQRAQKNIYIYFYLCTSLLFFNMKIASYKHGFQTCQCQLLPSPSVYLCIMFMYYVFFHKYRKKSFDFIEVQLCISNEKNIIPNRSSNLPH